MLLHPKYKELEPTEEYLKDKVVLAQAWKKSHQYIRSTNWYADTFELDRSAIDLDGSIELWRAQLRNPRFSLKPLRIVPAPKASSWQFEKKKKDLLMISTYDSVSHKWCPVPDKTKFKKDGIAPLRPLAHVSIRDQTYMTALMMCLANAVETLQGDSSTKMDEVHEKKVVNYGNRLYCTFQDDEAKFSWGNSTTYSKYFSDYQQFLARPIHFGNEAIQQKTKNEQVFEVELDLEKFFDRISRKKLIKKIKKLVDDEDDATLKQLLKSFDEWTWEEGSSETYDATCAKEDEDLPEGIPQGLVAGGFFANIYLLNFDKWMREKVGNSLDEGIRVVDYCRYVDDMRLILIVDGEKTPQSVEKIIHDLVGERLDKVGLSFNKKKTRIERFRIQRGGISTKLKDIQNKVSGPMSINEIDEQLGHLEGLIGLADTLRNDDDVKDNTNPLAMIESPSNDVREDTLLRFSANKISTLLKQKRNLIAQEVDVNGKAKPSSWDFLQERMARKFIACWSKDPSLVLMLKKGLEFFPDKRLLKPVLGQLLEVQKRTNKKEKYIAEYCLGEIFRHAAIAIHIKDTWAFPAQADKEGFFEALQNLAVDIISPDNKSNKNLKAQAYFFCLVRNDSPLEDQAGDENFYIITKMMKGFRRITSKMSSSAFIANSLIAYQLSNDKPAVIRAVNCLLEKAKEKRASTESITLDQNDLKVFSKKIAAESPAFFTELIFYAKANDLTWNKISLVKSLVSKTGILELPIEGDMNRFKCPVSLLGVLKRDNNPFAHENAALALVKSFFDSNDFDFNKPLDIANSKVFCDNWDDIQSLNTQLKFEPVYATSPIYGTPTWVEKKHKPFYYAGTFLRSCLLGSIDWSGMKPVTVGDARYSGFKTSFMKRQLGMMHSPEAIGGEIAPMSGWLSSLLFYLLQWPGTNVHDGGYEWPSYWDEKAFKKLINERIAYQKSLFCNMSGIPAYVERINLDWPKEKRDLCVVMVQSLLPLKNDFAEHGLMLDSPIYRARHRRHVASVAELLLHKVYSHNSIDDDNYKKSAIDLIIWPELAVNNDDIDILKSLSDKTGAMIFTGLTFTHLSGVEGPNNVAKWIIPAKKKSGRQFISRLQGKENMMQDEIDHAKPWRPYQLLIELVHPAFPQESGFRLTGSICYDATDIKMSADLKDKSDAYLVAALNKDVNTFDSMVDALYYHMYQHVALVNTGEFGGSVAKAPYKERHDKLITHVHGKNQVSISMFDMNMFDFRNIGKAYRSGKATKSKPAG